jgi:hypothetical protein
MAESETILRLGIEAAREGNREEARNLFSLLTRQEPDNVQAWLWLAGVAEGPDQRRAALERVLELEPDNEMALKGLQAMGVAPAVRSVEAPEMAAAAAGAAAAASTPERPLSDEELYAAELDSAFDLADELPRSAPPPRRDEDLAAAAAAGAAAGTAAALDDDRPRVRSGQRVRTVALDDDDDTVPARRGPSPLLWLLLGVIILLLLGFLLWQLFGNGDGASPQPTTAPGETAVTTPDTGATTLPEPTIDPNAPMPTADPNAPMPTADPNAPVPTADPNAPVPTADPNAPVPTADPNAPVPTADPSAPQPTLGPVAGANPLPIPPNAFISANNWNYTWPGTNICAFGCAVNLGSQVGNFTAQGTFLHVLVFVQNNTGTAQQVPADFFLLRDSQGRIFEARPDVAAAAWRPGSADVSATGSVPANGGTTSVYLVFDVPTDAQNLVLFSRYFIDQGWVVANTVQ